MRRARRILPALIFTVVATFICGVLWLPLELLRGLAKESTHALLSISNIQYWRESKEYFAATANQLPLLHCWSLSLEEQFYLFWPAFLFFVIKTGRLAAALVMTAAVSFVLSIIELRLDPQAAFFLMPFRIFRILNWRVSHIHGEKISYAEVGCRMPDRRRLDLDRHIDSHI
jgi:peptidoglycan/LPS O-acetylase OafA/YrhL